MADIFNLSDSTDDEDGAAPAAAAFFTPSPGSVPASSPVGLASIPAMPTMDTGGFDFDTDDSSDESEEDFVTDGATAPDEVEQERQGQLTIFESSKRYERVAQAEAQAQAAAEAPGQSAEELAAIDAELAEIERAEAGSEAEAGAGVGQSHTTSIESNDLFARQRAKVAAAEEAEVAAAAAEQDEAARRAAAEVEAQRLYDAGWEVDYDVSNINEEYAVRLLFLCNRPRKPL
jgi:hypothetical protein